MRRINDNDLDDITGGQSTYLTGPLINGVINVVKLIYEVGQSLGSGIRRLTENNICPLE